VWFYKQRSKVLSEFHVEDGIILIPVTITALVLDGVELVMLMKLMSLIVHK
jgi:hypothetical protein